MENIILFGASTLGIKHYKSFKNKNSNIFFSDNDEDKWGKIIEGVQVISPKDILNFKNPNVIITSMYYKDIQRQLIKMGIYNIEKPIKTPMDKVIETLKRENVNIAEYSALEVFGGNSSFHTLDYAYITKEIDIWEIDKSLEGDILENVPFAKVNIVDSYEEIHRTQSKYDLIVVDNPMNIHNNHCEHFDLFPYITNVFGDEVILILNVIPSIKQKDIDKYPYLLDEKYLQSRRDFYRVSDPLNISLDYMKKVYIRRFKSANYITENSFSIKRTFVHYMIFKMHRIGE